MYVGIDPSRAPLAKYASAHLKEIKYNELRARLAEVGVRITNIGPSSIQLDLRGLIPACGTVQRAQQELMEVLQILGADAVTMEPQDLDYVNGPGNVFSHAAARGFEAGVPQLQALLVDIPISEDPIDNAIPLFDRIHSAEAFVGTDQHPNAEVQQRLNEGAARDLERAGLLNANNNYADWMEPRQEHVAELPRDFQTSPKPFKSLFDPNGGE